MKKIFLILVLFLSVNLSFAQESTVDNSHVNWQISFDEATKKAKKEKKPILIFFTGSDWCPPCKKIERELIETDKFKNFSNKNLVLYKADFPRNRDLVSKEAKLENEKLKMNYRISSFPSIIVVDANGYVLGEKIGAYMTEYYYPFLEEIIRDN